MGGTECEGEEALSHRSKAREGQGKSAVHVVVVENNCVIAYDWFPVRNYIRNRI